MTAKPAPIDVEQVRQEYLHDADVSSAENAPGSFGCHELLDRTHLLSEQLQDWVLAHPACILNPEWFALAYQAMENLHRLYQDIGATHLSSDSSNTHGKT